MFKNDSNQILTERFMLRLICEDDLLDVWSNVSRPEISRDMSWDPHVDPNETKSLIERLKSDCLLDRGYTWSVRTKISGEFCGIFSLISIQRRHRALTYNRAELAYWCALNWQRRGVMTEAGISVISHAFSNLEINRIVVSHHIGNIGSECLIKRWGFTLIGKERQAFCKNGRWIDTNYYELLQSDFVT